MSREDVVFLEKRIEKEILHGDSQQYSLACTARGILHLTMLIHDSAVCSHRDAFLLEYKDSGLVTLDNIVLTY